MKRVQRRGDRIVCPPADDTAKKTRLSFARSKVAGEFLQVTIMRTAPDEHARWALHFALDQSLVIVLGLLSLLPVRELAIVWAQLSQMRPDLGEYIEALGKPPEPAAAGAEGGAA